MPRPQIAMILDDCLLNSVNQTSMPKGMHIGWWLPWRVSPTFASQMRPATVQFSSASIPSETRSRTCAKRLRTSQTSQVRWNSFWFCQKEWKNWGWKAGSSSPWCSCQRMKSIPHRWWFFQGAGNSKSWGDEFRTFLFFAPSSNILGVWLDNIFEAQLKLPGTSHFETSQLEPPEFCVATFHSCLFNLALPKIFHNPSCDF